MTNMKLPDIVYVKSSGSIRSWDNLKWADYDAPYVSKSKADVEKAELTEMVILLRGFVPKDLQDRADKVLEKEE